jgi:DNA-binding GntR family transcriptional regulator
MRTVRADDPRTKAAQIADDLRARIEAGEFAPGAKLPSLRKLAADYGVTQPTAADALQQLHSDGLAGHSSGRGYFVAEVQPARVATVDDRLEAIEAEVRELRSRVASLEAGQ